MGKSTTAVNLAVALNLQGFRSGILDADIYGPSQPMMLGVEPGKRPEIRDGKFMQPIIAHDLQCNSMGFLVDERTPMVWRAPMIISAFNQILNDTLWSDLDFLIVDMPPGTGDIQLSLAQSAKVAGALIITTPQDVALLDARKGIEMFNKVGVSVLGIVENMSTHICSKCGHEEPIFGQGGGKRLAMEYGVEVVGSLPLDLQIREHTDSGNPIVTAEPNGAIGKAYQQLASNLVRKIKAGENNSELPEISITDD